MSKHEIRRVRQSRQLLGRELAVRMGVSPARISVLERDEEKGAVTLKMMVRAAQALGCEFVYQLVPVESSPASRKPRLKCQPQEQQNVLDSRMRAALKASAE